MAKNNNLTDFLTDVANAIREKEGSIGTINPQDFSSKIKAISTGVDTSDGNIEPTTVLKGYKGYAKGVAVNGAIETYDGTVEDVVIARYDFTYAFRDVNGVGNAGAYWYDGDNESAVKSTLSVSYGSPVVPVGVSAQSNKVLLTFLGSPEVEIRNISVAGMTYQNVTNTEVVDNPTTIIGSSTEAKILLTLENNTAATGNIGSISADIDFDY